MRLSRVTIPRIVTVSEFLKALLHCLRCGVDNGEQCFGKNRVLQLDWRDTLASNKTFLKQRLRSRYLSRYWRKCLSDKLFYIDVKVT